MLAAVHHIIPLTTIARERLLPVKGKVLARLNQKVSPTDIVAEAAWAREHVLLDVARILNLSADAADRLIRCKVGDRLPAGAVIATGRGLLPKMVKVPREARVTASGGGQVLLEAGESRMELRAGISGIVVQIIPDRGVVIQTSGALIQGVWGNGRVDTGVMINLAEKPDTVLTEGRLDVSFRGSVIIAAQARDVETLQAAAELPVRGLILASLFPSLLPAAREMRYPIVLTDGFGSMPMNSAAYRLLTTNAKREATLNAEVYDRYSGARPEVIIPLPVSSEQASPRDVETFAAGQTVRMRRPPMAGTIGTVLALHPGLTTLPGGLRAVCANIKFENGEQALVPLVNLEVVG
ncbi:MAG: hypothetical protein HYX49_10605 [Chloroflexi bacterium]|nr:hypothetical protein [Chloroflexota bacterium]